MKIYYDLRDGRLNVYKLEDSIFKYIGGCGFNRESYFIKELKEKIFEVFSEKNKDVKLEDLEFMDIRFLHSETDPVWLKDLERTRNEWEKIRESNKHFLERKE